MAHRVNKECAVLDGEDTQDAGEEEGAEGAGWSAPQITGGGGKG